MMNDKKGSLGIFVLMSGLILSIMVQQGAVYFRHLLSYQEDYLIRQQLNFIAGSTMGVIAAENELPEGKKILFESEMLPSKQKLQVQQKVIHSSDACFAHLVVEASVESGAKKKIQQVRYKLDEDMQALAKDYVLMSPYLTVQNGADSTKIYKQLFSGEVVLPQLSFLDGKSSNSLAKLSELGLGRLAYCVSSVALSQKGNVSGSALLSSKGSITIAGPTSGKVTYVDEVILIANDNVSIGKNVCFTNVLIIAGKDVFIEEGCEIKGAVFSRNRITLKGPASLEVASRPIHGFSSVALSSFRN